MVIPALCAAVLVAELIDRSAARPIAWAVLVLLIAYCIARPADGREAFLIAAVPSAGTTLLHEALDLPVAVVLPPLIAVALYALWDLDRDAPGEAAESERAGSAA